MDKTSCRLTVFFENPFWVGIIECNEDGKLTASKITFYKEPKDYEIRDFILKKYNQLNFSPAVENVVIEKQKSYKKKQRDVRKTSPITRSWNKISTGIKITTCSKQTRAHITK